MKNKFILVLLASLGLSAGTFAANAVNAQSSIGVANFTTCIQDSKYGKKEQESFEALKKQMSTLLEDTEKQLREISAKFSDAEYLDGLSPDAEEELKVKFGTLNQELARYREQYYQVLNQANMRIMESMNTHISTASEKVQKDKKLDAIANKQAFFSINNHLDVTALVIKEMDKQFDEDAKAQAASAASTKVEESKAQPVQTADVK